MSRLEVPQTERTPLAPLTPYGVAKAYGHFITRSYRRRYGLHASSGILYNHESPRRPLDFVTRKVANAAAGDQARPPGRALARQPRRAARLGLRRRLRAGDVADAPAGRAGRLRDRDRRDAQRSGARRRSRSSTSGSTPREYVHIDSSLERGKAELHDLVGDPSKARERLGWEPTVSFEELVRLLVDADLERLAACWMPEPGRGFVAGGLRTRRLHESRLAVGAYRGFRRVLARLGPAGRREELLQPDPRPRRAAGLDLGAAQRAGGDPASTSTAQLAFLERYAPYLAEFAPRPRELLRTRPTRPWTRPSCTRSCAARKPGRIVELGSGHSTLVAAEAASRTSARERRSTTAPTTRIPSVVRPGTAGADASSFRVRAEELPLALFEELAADDTCSWSTRRTRSRPAATSTTSCSTSCRGCGQGVLVHFHDVFLPWEYPRIWAEDYGLYWAEQYLLQAFLSMNDGFEVVVRALRALARASRSGCVSSCRPGARDSSPAPSGSGGAELLVDVVVRRAHASQVNSRARASPRSAKRPRVGQDRRDGGRDRLRVVRVEVGGPRRRSTSGSAPASDDATGQPQAIASSGGRPNPS